VSDPLFDAAFLPMVARGSGRRVPAANSRRRRRRASQADSCPVSLQRFGIRIVASGPMRLGARPIRDAHFVRWPTVPIGPPPRPLLRSCRRRLASVPVSAGRYVKWKALAWRGLPGVFAKLERTTLARIKTTAWIVFDPPPRRVPLDQGPPKGHVGECRTTRAPNDSQREGDRCREFIRGKGRYTRFPQIPVSPQTCFFE